MSSGDADGPPRDSTGRGDPSNRGSHDGGASSVSDDAPTPRERVRRLGRAALLGAVLAGLAVLALVLSGESVQFASENVFALGALVFGFSMLGWSGSVFVGDGIENVQRHLGGNSNWTETGSRQAMAVLGSVGLGGMVGASVVTVVLASVT
ncbi:DUF7268 family protein [Halorussus pelagicus]|uniref:DUF7268 family protein n=1 Tax=Halorussus pelagicus TaxID=2505977 RepID=UPI000FFB2B71|nr:hypothetical protein [Halorussus pelagicus]